MENNEKDFMKNRPVASSANQAKDVYGPMKQSNISIITVILTIILTVCVVMCFVKGRILSGVLFLVLIAVLILSSVVSARSRKANSKPEACDHPDAIFKDHED